MSTSSDNPRIWQYLHRIRTYRAVLQYDRHCDDLIVWHWPTNERGERVTPSDLEGHRQAHQFRGPCCLCPMRQGESDFVEAAIVVATRGKLSGEYVAQCARNECGYFVYMERIHANRGIPIRKYRLRKEIDSPPAEHDGERGHRRVVRGPGCMRDVGRDAVPRQAPHATKPMTALDWFFRLDSVVHPGLTRSQFRRLFARCSLCGLTMTKRVFPGHECAGVLGDGNGDSDREVIDLTEDD